jgi:hypothetical protein
VLEACLRDAFGKGKKMMCPQECLPGSHHVLRISESEQTVCWG